MQNPEGSIFFPGFLFFLYFLTHKPAEGDIKKMSGYKDGRYRLRVGKYRIIYKYLTNNEIEVLCIMDVGSRGDIYK